MLWSVKIAFRSFLISEICELPMAQNEFSCRVIRSFVMKNFLDYVNIALSDTWKIFKSFLHVFFKYPVYLLVTQISCSPKGRIDLIFMTHLLLVHTYLFRKPVQSSPQFCPILCLRTAYNRCQFGFLQADVGYLAVDFL